MSTLSRLILLHESTVLSGILVAVVVGLVLVSVWRAPLWRWLAGSLAGCILVPPHAYPYDASILFAGGVAGVVPLEGPLLPSSGGQRWQSRYPLSPTRVAAYGR